MQISPAIEALLIPLDDSTPCGEDLAEIYDPDFQALEAAATGKPEQQYGDTIIAAVEPDWRQVRELAHQLAGRTRDLRIAILLLRSRSHLEGVLGAAESLQLIHGLLDRHWQHVHPQLDADDHDDPTMRVNALAALVHADTALGDLRQAHLHNDPMAPCLRDLESAFNPAEQAGGTATVSTAAIPAVMRDAEKSTPGTIAALLQMEQDARAINRLLDDHGIGGELDLGPLLKLLRCGADAARLGAPAQAAAESAGLATSTTPGTAAPTVAAATPAPAVVMPALPPGSVVLQDRGDVIVALGHLCTWIERHEPSNPAPLLLRRAQRLMSKNFLDIIRDLAPDGLGQIENLAGPDAAQE